MTVPESCISCRFFVPITTAAFPDVDGMCRRYAPNGPALKPPGGAWQVFPPMNSSQWCGDYRPAEGPVVGRMAAAA